VRWPWQKRKRLEGYEAYESNSPPKIKWPALESLTGITCTDEAPPDPGDVLPDAVAEYIRGLEDLAARLRAAAEVHYMRRREAGYRNRSWRRHRCTGLLGSIWELPIEYSPGNVRGITALIRGVR
jgi:hypothetical protein